MRIRGSAGLWIAVNVLGIAAFLASASRFWIEPELADASGASIGTAISWAFEALPIAVVFILADLGWLGLSLWRTVRGRPDSKLAAMLILYAWIAALVFDNAHHGI